MLRLSFWLAVAINILIAVFLFNHTGHFLGWATVDFVGRSPQDTSDFLAIAQFIVFGLTADLLVRLSIKNYNNHEENTPIPEVIRQGSSVLIYFITGVAAFVLLYDRSLNNLLAMSGAIGLSLGYVFRDQIADLVSSISIQSDGLVSLGDWIEVYEPGHAEIYKVIEIDKRMIVLQNKYDYVMRIANRKFITMTFANLSKQGKDRGARRSIEIVLDADHDVDKVQSILANAIRYVIGVNFDFRSWYACRTLKLATGSMTYLLEYECDPAIKQTHSHAEVTRQVWRFLRAAGLSLSNSIVIQKSEKELGVKRHPLLDIYGLSVLKVLDDIQIGELAKKAKIHYAEPGEQLIKIGEESHSMYLISEGVLDVKIVNKDGLVDTVASLWPGDCVGEMSLLTGAARSADVYAKTDATVIEISKGDIAPILQESPRLINHLSEILAQRTTANMSFKHKDEESEMLLAKKRTITAKIMSFFF